ncbi:patatin-like phospholipase family protein [Flavobacterium sp. 5]|uniref:patatin-like phospholipase family protein n=1 Tax=Flavobacterium sp. 5 TaxID=2035199 RepID=UPI000C2BD8BC|nr:patatin-like phospholipase family protein [Flavobacterium sp. 5]PKB16357.1 NTE family protein [Flavobacterium sp. 5]
MDSKTKSIGLILSGGGSKGIAHAGVLQFLEEKNIHPIKIAGSSAGSIVAALYGSGKSPKAILEFFKSIYFFHWKHFTFSKAGLIDSESFKEYFYDIFKDTTLSDLKIPVYITATDMIKGKSKVFDPETKTIDAIIASSSFPGIMSPYEVDGNLYSDGGILNHFPTDILKGKCDTLIGVYVSPIHKIEAKDLNSIKSVTARAFDLLSANSSTHKFDHCDWVIEPEALSLYSTFETSKINMEAIFNIGYESARKTYEELNLNI